MNPRDYDYILNTIFLRFIELGEIPQQRLSHGPFRSPIQTKLRASELILTIVRKISFILITPLGADLLAALAHLPLWRTISFPQGKMQ